MNKSSNYSTIVRSACGSPEHDSLLGPRIEDGTLTDCREKDERLDPGRHAAADCLLPTQDGGETFGLPVGKRQWVVDRDRASLRGPSPAVGVAAKAARPRLYLNEHKADWRKDESVDLVDAAVDVDEFEVRPRAPGFMIRQVVAKEVQRLPFPFESGLAYRRPTPCSHRFNRSSAQLALV